jgi:carbamoyltransferase
MSGVTILGINAYHGDVSAALVHDGRLIAAVEEERFSRIKHTAGFPSHAIQSCLDAAGIQAREVDHVAISRNPRANLLHKAAFALRSRPGLSLLRDRARNAAKVGDLQTRITRELGLAANGGKSGPRIHWVEHHPSHLASAFFVSPFEEAAVCAIDGFGDFVSTSWAVGRGSSLNVLSRTFFPHSLGLVYLAITQFLGFRRFGDEYKVMGLAPYGAPDFADKIRQLIKPLSDGRFELALDYFRHWSEGVDMSWEEGEPTMGPVYTPRLAELLGPERKPDEPVTARHEALAASLQVVYEEAATRVLQAVHERTKLPRLCLAGGCAMNSVMNGKIRERTPFREVFVQPASGDNGTALGAAFYVWNQLLGQPRSFVMRHSYWGPQFESATIEKAVHASGASARYLPDVDDLCNWTAERIAAGKVVGWFQGRMEWGARALGNRSIVADPRRTDMRDIINTKIKFRERFRPFAPSVLEEALDAYFVGAAADPFMIQVYPVRPEKRGEIPAVTHVDGSGRLQTVSAESNPLYWRLIKAFAQRTGVPIVLNTSFNENEPIVLKPEEALDCFLRTQMDVLVLGNYVLEKS